jgi:signal transduction histidine kinase/tetratricopeptide (TPR) repeat protein
VAGKVDTTLLSGRHPRPADGIARADLLGARYAVLGTLGRGGMSHVLRVFDRVRSEQVALKILTDGTPLALLAAEFRFIASLHHPGVVTVHDFGLTADRRPYFTMQLIDGPPLLDLGATAATVAGMRAVRAVFETLDFVHARGIVHGDIKPSNILLAPSPRGERLPKLLDFGIARSAEDHGQDVSGTVHYLAPEVIGGVVRDHRADLYAMGVVLYQLLTGQLPFDAADTWLVLQRHLTEPAPDPRDVVPDLPAELAELTLRLLEKSPGERFPRAREVVAALDAWIDEAELREAELAGAGAGAEPWPVTDPRPELAGGSRFVGRAAELDRLVGMARALAQRGRSVPAELRPSKLPPAAATPRPAKSGRPSAAAATSPPRLVVLTGEPGAGKTRLLEELRVRAQLACVRCLYVDFAGSPSAATVIARLAAVVGGAAGTAPDSPVELGGAPTSCNGEHARAAKGRAIAAPEVSLGERLVGAAEGWAAICAELASEEPVLLFLDALDEVPPDAAITVRAFVEPLREASAELPLAVIAAGVDRALRGEAAPTIVDDLVAAPEAERIVLSPLERRPCERLVRSLLGEVHPSAAGVVLDHVLAESGGNPGAVERVVQGLVATGAVARQNGAWVVADHLGGALPRLHPDAGLRQLAQAALASLDEETRRVAELGALLGAAFDRELLAEAAPEQLDVEAALQKLIEGRVVEPVADPELASSSTHRARFRFSQRTARDLLLAAMAAGQRSLHAWRLVGALERRNAGRARSAWDLDDVALFARHLRASGRALEAAEAAASLLERAGRLGAATHEATEILTSLLDVGPETNGFEPGRWAEIASLLADHERRAGHADNATRWLELVIEVAGRAGATRAVAAARRELGDLLLERGQAAGEEVLTKALREAEAIEDVTLQARAQYALAQHCMVSGRYDEAERRTSEAMRLAERGGDRVLWARALKLRATLSWYASKLEQAEADARAAADAYGALGSHVGAAEALGTLGNVLLRSGRLDAARTAFSEALEASRRAGWLTGIGKAHNALAVIGFQVADWDGACEQLRSALRIATRTGNSTERSRLLTNLAIVAMNRGEAAAAGQLLRQALEVAQAIGNRRAEALVLNHLGELLRRRGELSEARDVLLACRAASASIGGGDVLLGYECERRLLELELDEGAGGSVETAQGVAERAAALRALAQEQSLKAEAAHLLRVEAEALARAGARHDAEERLRDALVAFESLGSGYEAACVVRLAASLLADGLLAPPALAERLNDATRLLRRLRAQPELELARHARTALRWSGLVISRGHPGSTAPGDARASESADVEPSDEELFVEPPPQDRVVENAPAEPSPRPVSGPAAPPAPQEAPPAAAAGEKTSGLARASAPAPSGPEGARDRLLGSLLGVARSVGQLELAEVLGRIVDTALAATETERGFVILCDHDGTPKLRVSRGIGLELSDDQIRLSRSVLARVSASKRRLVLRDLSQAPAGSLGDSVLELGLKTVACVPLVHEGNLLGLLYLDARRPAVWSNTHVSLIDTLAAHAAVVVHNARMFEDQRVKSQQLVTVAQELFAPTDTLVDYAARLRSEAAGHSPALEGYAAVIHDQARRLQRVLTGLLDAGGSEPRTLGWSMVSVQVKDLAEAAIAQVRPMARLRRVDLALQVPGGLPTVLGNRARLIQVLTTMLTAAVRPDAGGNAVTLRAELVTRELLAEAGWRLPVKEADPLVSAGGGFEMSAEDAVRIDVGAMSHHEPAAPLDAAVPWERQDAGAGLGLPIAREIVRRHGGRLWAERFDGGAVCWSVALPALSQPCP